MNASTMFKSKWRDSSVVHHYLEKELLESSKPSLGEWQDKHTHIKYALCTKIKLSSFLHIFAAISYCLMPQIVVRGHPLGGSSTAHAPCRAVYVVRSTYILCTTWPALGMTNKGFQFLINFKLSCCRHSLRCSRCL